MSRNPVPFHIQRIARPIHVERILSIASDNQPLDSESAPLQLAQEGYNDKLVASHEREWLSVELALLAVSYLYVAPGAAVQTPLLLDRDTVEQLCPLCLALSGRIVAMIETASRTFPILGIHTGEWGSSVILRQPVDVSMLA